MGKFIITIDSSCDISYEFCEKHNVYPLLMKYNINGNLYTDTMKDEDINEFYQKMREGAAPKTTQINSIEYIHFWVPLLKEGVPIIHLSLSSGLSGTYQNGVIAVDMITEEYPNCEIHVVDSLMASGGICLPLFKLIEMRDNGEDVDTAMEYLNTHIRKINTFYTTSEMVYLQRGGRVKKITALVAGVLKMNPILKVDHDGHLVTHQIVPGSKKAMKRMIELVCSNYLYGDNEYIVISHSDCIERAEELGNALIEKLGIKKIIYTKIGTTIGAHTGPGLIAVFYYGVER